MNCDSALPLYGSQARGDADAISDVDILLVGSQSVSASVISPLLPSSCKGPIHVSRYGWSELEAMTSYGSLFVYHIATEARPLRFQGNGERRLSRLLAEVQPYRFARRDLRSFRAGISDALHGLDAGLPPHFELSTLGGIARHASVLTCYLAGTPTFGRESIQTAVQLVGMSRAGGVLELAHRFRLFEEGQCEAPFDPTTADVEGVAQLLQELLDRLEETLL